MWGASGNIYTCNIQGFFIHFGFIGSILYNCALSIYYVSVIRFEISEDDFHKKIERYLHVLCNVTPLALSIFLLQQKYFNSDRVVCWIGAYPAECVDDTGVECIRGGTNVHMLRKYCLGYIVYVVVSIIVVNMGIIIWKVVKTMRKSDRWKFGGKNTTTPRIGNRQRRSSSLPLREENRTMGENGVVLAEFPSFNESNNGRRKSLVSSLISPKESLGSATKDPLKFNLKAMRTKVKHEGGSLIKPSSYLSLEPPNVSFGVDDGPGPIDPEMVVNTATDTGGGSSQNRSSARLSEQSSVQSKSGSTSFFKAATDRRKSMSLANSLGDDNTNENLRVVVVQALLYILAFLSSVVFSAAVRIIESGGKPVPFAVYVLSRVFTPLQGFLNILVYTRPHVSSRRNQNPECSWLTAFWETIKSGGDNDTAGQSRRGRHKASIKTRQKIEADHKRRMTEIRRTAELKRNSTRERQASKRRERRESLRVTRDSISTTIRRISLKAFGGKSRDEIDSSSNGAVSLNDFEKAVLAVQRDLEDDISDDDDESDHDANLEMSSKMSSSLNMKQNTSTFETELFRKISDQSSGQHDLDDDDISDESDHDADLEMSSKLSSSLSVKEVMSTFETEQLNKISDRSSGDANHMHSENIPSPLFKVQTYTSSSQQKMKNIEVNDLDDEDDFGSCLASSSNPDHLSARHRNNLGWGSSDVPNEIEQIES